MSQAAQKTTPLYEEHVRRGAKIISFGGWLMPVQYTSIVEEHHAVRNNVGIFDISHMGQVLVSGPAARGWVNTMLTNNINRLEVGQGQYTFFLNEGGGIIDDLIVYRIEEGKFLLVVNVGRTGGRGAALLTRCSRRRKSTSTQTVRSLHARPIKT